MSGRVGHAPGGVVTVGGLMATIRPARVDGVSAWGRETPSSGTGTRKLGDQQRLPV
ncbi:hypothetical protein [Allokutzneria multivorans]|uniref:hypothetical protein n=1 Tax=Allokutzneria multivorans TaxID=1142134 RepID=UPI0031ECFC83